MIVDTKKVLLFVAVLVLALMLPAVAMANYAIHGNYAQDTDACAGCHRAHTSVSTLTWTNNAGGESSSLLVSSATSMQEFCYACHDDVAIGADTNVQSGIYRVDGGDLNGGGFDRFDGMPVTSSHYTEGVTAWGAWGGGYWQQSAEDTMTDGSQQVDPITGDVRNQGQSTNLVMDCATCHDPHGSPNYRILKSSVLGNYVGGYQPSGDPNDPDPDGWVSSVETGWPAGGFRLHTAYPLYEPSYTVPKYAKGYDMLQIATTGVIATDTAKGMSGWCIGCHSVYMTSNDASRAAGGYDAADTYGNAVPVGFAARHRHPINVPLTNYLGNDTMIADNPLLPLAHSLEESATGPVQDESDWIECLTCHRAHGTSATMIGWANEKAALTGDEVPDFISTTPSALLRLDNRGVCEGCHNK